MLWNLRALRDLGGRAHLDALHRRLGQSLRIPEDFLWLEYPPEKEAGDSYIVRHHMRFALTDLNYLGLVNSHGQGNWSLSDKGANFLEPLDEEDAPTVERQWSRETGIKLTPAERKLQRKLIAGKRAEHKKRFSKKKSPPPPPTPPERPDDWPEGPFRSRGAPRFSDVSRISNAELRRRAEVLAAASSRAKEFSRLLAPLDPREREILKLRFGLDSGEPRPLEEVAEHFGVTRERVHQLEARAMSKLRRLSADSPRTLVARFEGICVICGEPINIGDPIAIAYQDAPPDVEGWRHDRCPRSGPGGARVPARVPPPGNPPKESAVRRRQLSTKDADAAIVEYLVGSAAEIYGWELESLSGETTFEDLDGYHDPEDEFFWLPQAELLIGIEDEFDIDITDEELSELDDSEVTASLGLLAALVQRKLIEKQVSGKVRKSPPRPPPPPAGSDVTPTPPCT